MACHLFGATLLFESVLIRFGNEFHKHAKSLYYGMPPLISIKMSAKL